MGGSPFGGSLRNANDGAGGADAARPLLHHHAQAAERKRQEQRSAEAALVDWAGLICQLCKRRLKDRPTLQKHVDESALHQTNLAAWRDERAAAATAAAAAAPLAPKNGLLPPVEGAKARVDP